MYRQSSSRNQRSKGLKLKYVLQICLLLAVCFWLIYQVKHSHDKKREFEELDSKSSLQTEPNGEILKLGRKDIVRRQEEEEESKPEDDGSEEKTDLEQENRDVRGQENVDDSEVEREDDSADEESEAREVDFDEDRSQKEGENVSVFENESDVVDKSSNEAREENYKADDASSAVTHDAQTGAFGENENGSIGNSNERPENVPEEDRVEKNREDLELGGGDETVGSDEKSNITTNEMSFDALNKSENRAPPNDTLIEEGFNRDLTGNGLAKVKRENHDLDSSMSNDTSTGLNSTSTDLGENKFAKLGTNDGISTDSVGSGDTKDAKSEPEDSSISANTNNHTKTFLLGQNSTVEETSVVAGNDTETSNDIDMEKEDKVDGSYDNSESTGNENIEEEMQRDGIDLSDSDTSVEKEVGTDLETLPEIQTEGANNDDDVAAE